MTTYLVLCRDSGWLYANNVVKIYIFEDGEPVDHTEELVEYLKEATGLEPYMLSDGSGWAMIQGGESFGPGDFAECFVSEDGSSVLFVEGHDLPKITAY